MTNQGPITLQVQPAGYESLGRRYEVPAWQLGPLAAYHDRYGARCRWHICHLATLESLVTCYTEEQARAALPVFVDLPIDWSWTTVPSTGYWQTLVAIEPVIAQLFPQRLIDAETANLAPFWSAGAAVHLALDHDLPPELRESLGLSVGRGASLYVGTPAMMVVHVHLASEQWTLGLDGTQWKITPQLRIRPDGTFPSTESVNRRLLAGWFEDTCHSYRRNT